MRMLARVCSASELSGERRRASVTKASQEDSALGSMLLYSHTKISPKTSNFQP